MKPGVLPPSQNVIDLTGLNRGNLAHMNPAQQPITGQMNAMGSMSQQLALQNAMQLPPDNPFRKMLMDMTVKNMVKTNPNAAIPIPTPRPDPSIPYKRPKVFPNN